MLDTTALTPLPTLSTEQLTIAEFVATGVGNLLVEALAGTGKTFLILNCIPLMRGSIGIVAYNRKIAREIKSRVAKAGYRHVDVRTFHAFGALVLKGMFPKAKLEGTGKDRAGFYKFDKIAEELAIPQYLCGFVRKLMSMAMQHGFGIAGTSAKDQAAWDHLVSHYNIDSEIADDNVVAQLRPRDQLILEGMRFAYQGLNLSKKMAHEVYSFDEMLWLPLILNAKMPQFDWLAIDEGQDTNPTRREMARRMMKPTTRSMWVGDKNQAIFGFTGADADSLDIIQREFNCKVFPMTMTFRCGKKIVAKAQRLVSAYKAAPGNHEGEVLSMSEADFNKLDLVPGQDAVICRNTKPLITVAYSLIKRGIPAHIEGKEIGKGLLALCTRWATVKTIPGLMTKLDDWSEKQIAKLTLAKKEMEIDALTDKVEAVKAIAAGLPKGATLADLRNKIDSMFSDTEDGEKAPTVALMTAHKSKGLEFSRVFGWNVAGLMPSKRAKQEHELVQEHNLEYVLYTRAINTYVDVVVS